MKGMHYVVIKLICVPPFYDTNILHKKLTNLINIDFKGIFKACTNTTLIVCREGKFKNIRYRYRYADTKSWY